MAEILFPKYYLDRTVHRPVVDLRFPLLEDFSRYLPAFQAHGGFDAVVQVRGDALAQDITTRSLGTATTIPITEFSSTTRTALYEFADGFAEWSFVVGRNLGFVRHRIAFEPVSVEFGLEISRVDLPAGTLPLNATLFGNINVVLKLQETAESWNVRQSGYSPFDSRVPPVREERTVEYARLEIRDSIRASVATDEARARFWVVGTPKGDWEIDTDGPIQLELAQAVEDFWNARFGPRRSPKVARSIHLTPVFSLFQDHPYTGASGANRFLVEAKVSHQAWRKANVTTLHLCVSLKHAATSLAAVLPFHESSSFGYFAAGNVLREALRLGWNEADTSAPEPATVPMTLTRDEAPVQAAADVVVTMIGARDFDIITHPEAEDHVRLWVDAEVRMVELRDDTGQVVPFEGDLTELRNPAPFSLDVHMRLFERLDAGPLGTRSLGRAIRRMSNLLTLPLARTQREGLRIHSGNFSQPVGGMYLRGELS